MIIEVNKDVQNYKETVVLGLTARQLVYSVLSVVIGGGIVLLLYSHVGLTTSAYIAIPVVAPIALSGFYSYNGMTFMEMMKLKLHFTFGNLTLTYVSEESEKTIQKIRMEEAASKKGSKRNKGNLVKPDDNNQTGKQESTNHNDAFQKAKKSMFLMLLLVVIMIGVFAGFIVWYKYMR